MTPRTILVVEDSDDDRAMIRRLLRGRPRPYRIVEAATGADGLAACRADPPDCVLLDFHLPDIDGYGFLQALAPDGDDGVLPALPVVMLTGRDDDVVAAGALQLGAQDYLGKDDLSGAALARAVENAIGKFHVLRELAAQRAAAELRNRRLEALHEELQARMAELADATRAKDRFLAVMSHEMRTPLNAILGYSELLEMELEGPLTEGQQQHVQRIRVGSRHLLDLTNDVLDLTRADARRLDLDLRPVDLPAAVEEVVALLERQAGSKGLQLEAEPAPAALHVLADLPRLRQVLTNLIGNAIKFTDEGWVRVRCLAPTGDGDPRVRVEVQDSGIGIDPAALPLVFEEFYQAKDDLTRRHGGSGLGLAISHRLVHLMGGDIEVTSEPGRGSTFTLLLPAADPGSELRADDVAYHGARLAGRADGRRLAAPVAVVALGDDERALVDLARRVAPGVRLAWTTDPGAVAALAREHRATLVVLDAGCADGAAWRAARAMQDAPDLADAAVLLLPSLPRGAADGDATMLDLGWVSLVPKPFTAAQLTHAVSAASAGAPADAPPIRDVLVVDDDADSRRVAARFLDEAGIVVREAADGETALAAMLRHPPDVVVLDLMMPVLDGFGVLAAMRADPLLAPIPVVVLTAKSLTDGERRFLSRAAARVLQKGAHRLADVAALVLRAAGRARRDDPAAPVPAHDSTADAAPTGR